MKPHEDILRDYLWGVYRVKNSSILNSIKKFLTVKEQEEVVRCPTVVTKKRIVAVVDCLDELTELILIKKDQPNKAIKVRLNLKGKHDSGKF